MNHPDHVRDLAAILKARAFQVTELPIVEARIADDTGEREAFAINDFVLERVSGHTVRLDLFIEGVLLNRYSGDGLIVATATGSTAYTLAAGGPVVHPEVGALIVTPVNAHRPIQFHSLQFPLVLPLDSALNVTVVDRTARPARLVADGTQAGEPQSVSMRWSGRSIRLMRTADFNYVGALVQKVIGTNSV
jgi:NAD+ kinase